MTEEAETAAVAVKKKPVKKAAKKKPAARKTAAKKSSTTAASAAPAAKATPARGKKPARKAAKKRGRPAGTRRGKKAKQFAYMLLNPQEDGSQKASTINGPFATDKDALDDASIMAEETTTIVLFREAKRGRVQKSTKFVAGR